MVHLNSWCSYRSPPQKRWMRSNWIRLDWIGMDLTRLDCIDLQWLKRQAVPNNQNQRVREEKSYNFPHSENRLEGEKENIWFLNHKIWPQASCVNVWKDYLVCQLSVLHDCPNGLQLFSLKAPDSKPTTYLVLMIWMPYESLCSFWGKFHFFPFRSWLFFNEPELRVSPDSLYDYRSKSR